MVDMVVAELQGRQDLRGLGALTVLVENLLRA